MATPAWFEATLSGSPAPLSRRRYAAGFNERFHRFLTVSFDPLPEYRRKWCAYTVDVPATFTKFPASLAGRAVLCRIVSDRAHLIGPTHKVWGRQLVWSHPAFANRSVYVRNDEELIRVDLRAPD